MSPEQANPSPEQLIVLKDEFMARWQQLPRAHQASMALVLLDPVMESDWGVWMREAITLRWPAETGGSPSQVETYRDVQETILAQWLRLSPDAQAIVLVRQLREVLGSGLGAPLRRELGLSGEDLEMPVGEETSPSDRVFPITGVSRADLKRASFNEEAIANLTDEDMKQIARKMEDYYVDGPFWDDLEVVVKLVLNEKGRTPTE